MHTHTFPAPALLSGFLILQLGMAGWSFGSIYQRRQAAGAHPIVIGAVQQLAAGLCFLPLVLFFPGHAVHWSLRGVARHFVSGGIRLHRGLQRLYLCA